MKLKTQKFENKNLELFYRRFHWGKKNGKRNCPCTKQQLLENMTKTWTIWFCFLFLGCIPIFFIKGFR